MGQPFANVGYGMRNTANAFQVYQLTGDAKLLGLTFLFQGIPSLIMGLFGGTLADLFDRRLLLKIALSVQIAVALLLGILTASGHIEVWHIYAITFTAAAVGSLTGPSQSALLPTLVPRSHLMNAIALQSTNGQVAMLVGPLMGGLLVDSLGAASAYFINAVLIIPALTVIWMLRIENEPARRKVKLNVATIFEGFVLTVRSRVLFAFVMLDMVTFVLGYYPAMMPVMAKDVLGVGATGLGALLAAGPFGSMLGMGGVLLLGNIRRKGAAMILVNIGHAIVLMCFAFSPWFALSIVLIAMLGFLDSLSVNVRQTSFQLLATDETRGRVMSVLSISAISANSLGGAYLGFITVFLGGPREALFLGGLMAGAVALGVGLFWKRVRDFTA